MDGRPDPPMIQPRRLRAIATSGKRLHSPRVFAQNRLGNRSVHNMLPALIGSTLNLTSRIAPGLAGKWTFALFCYARPCKVLPAEREMYESAVVDKVVV